MAGQTLAGTAMVGEGIEIAALTRLANHHLSRSNREL